MNNKLIEKYTPIIDNIIKKYKYDSNISHLLYIIIPAFISNYSIYQEKLILEVFNNTRIIINENNNSKTEAFYTSIPKYINNKIITNKYIVIQNYKNISLVQLLDDLVHEFNHAINSYNNELLIKNNTLYLRTGLTNISYYIPNLEQIKKDNSYILEEILNTKQTENIINIIKNYKDSSNDKINNIIYSLNNETDNNYSSDAYLSFKLLLEPILNNRTFTSTINSLRIKGNINDIEAWFNNITNIDNSYNLLNNYLVELVELNDILDKKILKNITINKIKDKINNITNIINTFNSNTNYK